jgi:lipopolysaccharide transport system ATP-binding protein
MAHISLVNVGLDIPIFNPGRRSLKKKILQEITGGNLYQGDKGPVVVRALQNINLELKHGDKVGLLGHNGAGKSTLLRVLSGVYKPTSGQVAINGQVASLIDVSLGIDSEATGLENIFIRAALIGLSKKQINEQLEEIIEFSELGDFIDMPVRTYSSGMHLRLAFSVSTVIRPEILIMDEWLSVGDENFKHKAENRLKKLIDNTSILIIASHSKELLLKTCNRIIWLEHGCIKLQGSPADICQKYFTNPK